ncbi:MAG: cysteine desulfurase family protein [Planctomycetota bacterium]
MSRIYLDANATTPLDGRVREAMLPWLSCGNASSPHTEGRRARAAIDDARDRVARLVGAQPREIVFTSGATEANAIALVGTVRANSLTRVATSPIEHPSVLRTLQALPDVDVDLLAVGRSGCVDADANVAADFVSLMLANNETGAVQPVRAIADRARIAHTDAVQACGKTRVDVDELGVDLLSLSAHKMGGPKGAGALFVRRGTKIEPLARGGAHERGLRAGTENVAAIVGLGAAAQLAGERVDELHGRWSALWTLLAERLRDELPDARFNTPTESDARVANTLNVTLPGVEAEAVLLALDLDGIAIATGSACSSGAVEPSHVLQAMGLSRTLAEQSVRISMHADTTEDDLHACVRSLSGAVKKLRALKVRSR